MNAKILGAYIMWLSSEDLANALIKNELLSVYTMHSEVMVNGDTQKSS